mmetsp:Transcript_24126/g.35382  ORF Transcript_24126/g.35382 Transcript_24126/m.35382 type:complete len:119 (+) Transcript_24126:1421-1777(+)
MNPTFCATCYSQYMATFAHRINGMEPAAVAQEEEDQGHKYLSRQSSNLAVFLNDDSANHRYMNDTVWNKRAHKRCLHDRFGCSFRISSCFLSHLSKQHYRLCVCLFNCDEMVDVIYMY